MSDGLRPRLAWVGPLPPATSGIADYSADVLARIGAHADIELFFEGTDDVDAALKERFICRPLAGLDEGLAKTFELVVYQIGNSALHHAMTYQRALQAPGVVVLHEPMLHSLLLGQTLQAGDVAGYRDELRYAAGRSGEREATRQFEAGLPLDLWTFPLFERLVDRSLGVIVHSRFARSRILESRPLARIERVPMGIDLAAAPLPSADERAALRARLGLASDTFVIASFGLVTPEKRLAPALAAFARLRADQPRARFVIVGEAAGTFDVAEMIGRIGGEGVSVLGRTRADEFRDWMMAADVAVNLRYPTGGETSASLLRLLALGRPVVVSSVGSFLEVPEGACIHVELDEAEEATLEAVFRALALDHALAQGISRAARRFVESEHSLNATAHRYLEALAAIRQAPAVPLAPAPPLPPGPASERWLALLREVGTDLADLGIGESDDGLLVSIASQLAALRSGSGFR